MVTQVTSTVNDPYSDQVATIKAALMAYEGQPVISDKGVGQVVAGEN